MSERPHVYSSTHKLHTDSAGKASDLVYVPSEAPGETLVSLRESLYHNATLRGQTEAADI